VADSVREAVRIRVPSDVFFVPGPQPWAPADEDMDLTALNISAPIPSGRASDLDLYVAEPGRPPWWPNEQAGRQDNSIIGPLVNPETGQAVTGQVRHHGNATHPTPEASSRGSLVCRTGACEASRSAKRMASSGW